LISLDNTKDIENSYADLMNESDGIRKSKDLFENDFSKYPRRSTHDKTNGTGNDVLTTTQNLLDKNKKLIPARTKPNSVLSENHHNRTQEDP
jgi:hypothetical protein